MQNGTYPAKSVFLGTEYRLVAYNGSLRFIDKHGNHVQKTNEVHVKNFYELGERVDGTHGTYDVAWFSGGKLQERIVMNKHYAFVKSHINELKKRREYAQGLLRPLRCNI